MADTQELTVINPGHIEPSRYDQPEMIKTIKETVCKGATDSQFKMFIEVCKGTGLNPFLKEIYFAPEIGVMASRDGYLRVANDHPMFDGMSTHVDRDDKGIPIKATCTVWRKDRSHPIVCEAFYNEYSKGSGVWMKYKSAMIGKVAEVLALKRSFTINGVVTEEEVGQREPKQPEPQSDPMEGVPEELHAIFSRLNTADGLREGVKIVKMQLTTAIPNGQEIWDGLLQKHNISSKGKNPLSNVKGLLLEAFDIFQNHEEPEPENVAAE